MLNRIVSYVVALCIIAAIPTTLTAQESRTWTSSSGVHHVTGKLDVTGFLASENPENVTILDESEDIAFECACDKLSEADLKYLANLRSACARANNVNRDVILSTVDDSARENGTRITFTYDNIEYAFVWIGPGAAMEPDDALTPEAMKRKTTEKKKRAPKRTYVVKEGFWIMETETTLAMWNSFLRDSRYKLDRTEGKRLGYLAPPEKNAGVIDGEYDWKNPGFSQSANQPVTLITHKDAEAFCRWLSQRMALQFQLPRRDQWRLASQPAPRRVVNSMQTFNTWFFGGDDMWERGNLPDANYRVICPRQAYAMETVSFIARDSCRYTAPVKSFRPNANGVYDMVGNVGEMLDGETSAKEIVDSIGGSWFHLPNFNPLCWRSIDSMTQNLFDSAVEKYVAAIPSASYAQEYPQNYYQDDPQEMYGGASGNVGGASGMGQTGMDGLTGLASGVTGSTASILWSPVVPEDVVATCYTGFRPIMLCPR
ncbi:MAG: SUMF1/EgtB/PvdO family nonheme iron enzyme [Planctomycetia bacterium]|nr:SUMF1/EgtB/PvdO family nonheme iron enzyme [Planctomycetia bacterium]